MKKSIFFVVLLILTTKAFGAFENGFDVSNPVDWFYTLIFIIPTVVLVIFLSLPKRKRVNKKKEDLAVYIVQNYKYYFWSMAKVVYLSKIGYFLDAITIRPIRWIIEKIKPIYTDKNFWMYTIIFVLFVYFFSCIAFVFIDFQMGKNFAQGSFPFAVSFLVSCLLFHLNRKNKKIKQTE